MALSNILNSNKIKNYIRPVCVSQSHIPEHIDKTFRRVSILHVFFSFGVHMYTVQLYMDTNNFAKCYETYGYSVNVPQGNNEKKVKERGKKTLEIYGHLKVWCGSIVYMIEAGTLEWRKKSDRRFL